MKRFLAMALLIAWSSSVFAEGNVDAPTAAETPEAIGTTKKLSPAEMRSDDLDRLFGSLQANTGLRDPAKTESEIWHLWMQSDSKTADLLLAQATRAMNDGETDLAETMFTKIVEEFPNYAEAYNKRASLYFLVGKNNLALKDIDKTLELEPRHFGALIGRGSIYRQEKKFAEALSSYKEALSINPAMKNIEATIKELQRLSPSL